MSTNYQYDIIASIIVNQIIFLRWKLILIVAFSVAIGIFEMTNLCFSM